MAKKNVKVENRCNNKCFNVLRDDQVYGYKIKNVLHPAFIIGDPELVYPIATATTNKNLPNAIKVKNKPYVLSPVIKAAKGDELYRKIKNFNYSTDEIKYIQDVMKEKSKNLDNNKLLKVFIK